MSETDRHLLWRAAGLVSLEVRCYSAMQSYGNEVRRMYYPPIRRPCCIEGMLQQFPSGLRCKGQETPETQDQTTAEKHG